MKKFSYLFLLVLLSSCSHRLLDFTVVSSKNMPITERGTEFKKATQRVTGEDSKFHIFGFGGLPDIKEAVDQAIEKFPGAVALTDGVISYKTWSIFLVGNSKYIVEGTPLYTQEGADSYNRAVYGNTDYNQPQKKEIEESDTASKEKEFMRVSHTVESGETLATIANSYQVTVPNIMKWNKLKSNKVSVGTKLIIYISE